MKRCLWIGMAGLVALVFSCQKDSLSGLSSEELALREGGRNALVISTAHTFKASYELFEVDALPDDGPSGLRPPKGWAPRMYAATGSASLLGELAPGMSYEIHYLPPGVDVNKDTVEALVWGRFLSRDDFEDVCYIGECIWYPDGKRATRYEFYRGTGCFEDAFGSITGAGLADQEGAHMRLEAKGEIVMPLQGVDAPTADPF